VRSVWLLGLGLVVLAAAAAAIWVPMVEVVSRFIPEHRRAMVFGIFSSAGGYGALINGLVVPPGLLTIGWRQVWLDLGLITLLLAAIGYLAMRRLGMARSVGTTAVRAPSIFKRAALVALLGSTSFAVSLAMTRRLRGTPPITLVVWQYIGSGLIGAGLSPLEWATPGLTDWGLLLLLGMVSAACFVMISRALALAQASLLAPFQYSAILWAGIFGWMFWADIPTPRIILGNAILIASGLFVFYRERRLAVSVSDKVEQIP